MKKVLVLGAGLVARPMVQYLMEQPDFFVTVASRTVSKAEKLVEGHASGKALALNVKDDEKLEELIKEHDLTVSLLPYTFHVKVANFCIKHKKHVVTTSYVSDAMAALDKDAKAAGITILNEIGLDPGIDHMSAMQIIHDVENAGGKIVSFKSYCGGLPAPEANDNPFGYKFSWSPRGVLMAGKNNAQFLLDGKKMEIPGKDLFDNYIIMQVGDEGEFEGYPNRNSLPYIETYGIKDTRTMLRGTLRNKGWCSTIKKFAELGILDDTINEKYAGMTYSEFMADIIGEPGVKTVKAAVAKKLGISEDSYEIKAMDWLGLFGDSRIPEGTDLDPMDILSAIMQEKMNFKDGERDMIVLFHMFEAEYPETGKKESIHSLLVDYGIPNGDSAMARTVSLPAAIGVKMILTGKITEKGVLIPVSPGIYEPVMEELGAMGIKFVETKKEM